MRDVIIAPADEGKGRTFRATMLASVEADLLWQGGLNSGDHIRPVWAMFAGSDQEMRAFSANLQMGRRITFARRGGYSRKEDRMEFLKSSGFRSIWQREEEGSIVTVFLPELIEIDPGMVDPMGIKFVLLPSHDWHAAQHLDIQPMIKHAERLQDFSLAADWVEDWAPTAFLFAAYLDRRTRCPLVADGRFFLQLMLACLKVGAATFAVPGGYQYARDLGFGVHGSRQYFEDCTADVGLRPGIAFKADHEGFEKLLAEQVELFFRLTRGR